jgi:hypothetical protein
VEQDIDRFLDRALSFHRDLDPRPDLRREGWQGLDNCSI